MAPLSVRVPLWRRLGGWRRILHTPLAPDVDELYRQMLAALQFDVLLLIMAIGEVSAVLLLASTYHMVWVQGIHPPIVFFIHLTQVLLIGVVGGYFLYKRKVLATWTVLLLVSLGLGTLQTALTHEPGMLIFSLFTTVGVALTLPLWFCLTFVLMALGSTAMLVEMLDIVSTSWPSVGFFYGALTAVMAAIGLVVRRSTRRIAIQTIQLQTEAAQRALLEHQVIHLQQNVRQVALLKHDLRQPLRVVQGQLLMLDVDSVDDLEVVQPALAALNRAERLLSNLLDQARQAAGQQRHHRHRIDLNALLERIQAAIPGLARYYTDPLVQVDFDLQPLPSIIGDYEHLERALFNLLDNALTHALHNVQVSASVAAGMITISIRDDGVGIPDTVVQAFQGHGVAPNGFGLVQAHMALKSHDGELIFVPQAKGTLALARIPSNEERGA